MAVSDIWKVVKTIVTLADDLQKYHAEIKEIRQELRDLTIIVHGLAQQIKHSKETTAGERANILLEIENRMLKFERRLAPPKDDS
jgi:cell division protein ZapA (FtsZ GTPase activity inhibitor)